MKFKLGEIRGMKEPLVTLLDKEIPIKAAWKLNRLIKALDKELGEIEDFRINLVKQLGTEDDTGNIQVPKDKMTDFIEGFNEVLSQEVEIDFEPIDIDIFGDIGVSTKDLMTLEKIFQ